MKIISTNVGQAQTITWKDKTVQTGIFKKPRKEPVFLTRTGVKGDAVVNQKVHGGIDKSCYLYSAGHYAYWQEKYPGLDWNWGFLGENLTVKGLAENKMHIGDVLEIGEAIVKITQPRIPCYKLGVKFGTQEILKQFLASGFSGIYVKVLQEGAVRVGDDVYLLERPSDSLTVAEVFSQFTLENRDKYLIDKALQDSNLAQSIVKDFRRFREGLG